MATANDARGPLLIIGNPRSGTTLLRLLLNAHTDILVPPECAFVVWLYDKYRDWPRGAVAIDGFVADLLACRKFDTWNIDAASLSTAISDAAPASYAELCQLVYLEFGVRQGKQPTIWGDKNNFHTQRLERLDGIFPGALFLHIVRDGRDVACSYRQVMTQPSVSPYAPKLPVEIAAIAREWQGNVSSARSFLEALPPHRQRTLRYEDLVADPAGRLESLCAWLDVPYETAMLTFHDSNRRQQSEPVLTMDWKMRTLEPASNAGVGRYIELLSRGEQEDFKAIAGAMLAHYRYD